jgi:PEP-CTERM motif-containing protein
MKNVRGPVFVLMLVSALAIAPSVIASPITAEGLLGNTVSGVSSVTGTTTINPLGSLGPPAVIGPATEFAFCVGPNGDNCASSGLFGTADLSDAAITFVFFGSTFPATGSFSIALNFLNPILGNVALSGGATPGFNFGLTSSSPSSLVFTGTPGAGGVYNAIGGSTVTFSVATVPEPGTLFLLGLGLLGGSRALRRRRPPQI